MRIHRLIVAGAATIVIAVAGVTRVLAPVGAQGSERPLTYTVQPGETLYRIARQFNLPLDDLMAANAIANPSLIQAGQVLVIPIGGAISFEPAVRAPDLGILGPDGRRLTFVDKPPILSNPRDTLQPDLGILGSAPPPAGPAAVSAAPEPMIDSAPLAADAQESPAAVEMESGAGAESPGEQIAEAPPRDPRAVTDPAAVAPDLGILAPPEHTAPAAPNNDAAETGIRNPRDVTDPAAVPPDLGILAPEAAPWLVNGSVVSTGGPVVRTTYRLGQELGNNPHAFSKIGDCNSEPPFFLVKFDEGAYDLGPYSYLQPAIDHFAGSFARSSATVWIGNHAWAVFDPTWANPAMCLPGEAPIECEFRINRPSFVLIRLGTNEAYTPDLFETNLRQIIEFALERGTIPILGTKADRLEGSDAINERIRALADEYKIPLWDFGRAADSIPGRGLRADGFHMTYGAPYYSDPAALQTGHAVHNLTALMALDAVWRSVME